MKFLLSIMFFTFSVLPLTAIAQNSLSSVSVTGTIKNKSTDTTIYGADLYIYVGNYNPIGVTTKDGYTIPPGKDYGWTAGPIPSGSPMKLVVQSAQVSVNSKDKVEYCSIGEPLNLGDPGKNVALTIEYLVDIADDEKSTQMQIRITPDEDPNNPIYDQNFTCSN